MGSDTLTLNMEGTSEDFVAMETEETQEETQEDNGEP
jgi:hypothetical protein